MRRLIVVLALGTFCTGCAAGDWFRDRLEGRSVSAQLVAQADDFVRNGRPSAARDLYNRVASEATRDAVHATALYRLARLYVDPASGLRDYRVAQATFERLLTEYPPGEWTADARAWQAALAELLMREAEAARVKADLQRLKRIDLNLERRR